MNKWLIIFALILIPLSYLLYHLFHDGLPIPFEENKKNLYENIIPGVLERIKANKINQNKISKKILIPIPNKDFDPSETSYPWKIMKFEYNFEIIFSTENGEKGETDKVVLEGKNLDFLMNLIFSIFPFKTPDLAKKTYSELENDINFKNPIKWSEINIDDYDGVWIPGGHANGMRQMLNSEFLQNKISEFWATKKPIAAVCHGVILLARSKDKKTGKSVLFNKKTTSITNYQERFAQLVTKWKLGDYYQTYPESTEDEIKRAVYDKTDVESTISLNKEKKLYDNGHFSLGLGTFDNPENDAFIVEDENYLSGRWPGDVCLLSHRFAHKILGN
jgi:putative intracellular protease/amidase